MSRWETGALERCSVARLERWAAVLNAHVVIDIRVDGERPLTDARHAALQDWLVGTLRTAGWLVEAEPSFNVYGDRGRIDVLAYHPALHILLVVEIKTRIEDAQELLGRLDVKKRVAPGMARDRGWQVDAVVPAIFILDGSTARRRIAMHQALFASFPLRARRAMAWLRRPHSHTPAGILAFVTLAARPSEKRPV